jgi:hypothetical protein
VVAVFAPEASKDVKQQYSRDAMETCEKLKLVFVDKIPGSTNQTEW